MNIYNKKYTVIKSVVSKELLDFCCQYIRLKKQVARTLFDTGFIPPFETMWGIWNDDQVQNTYSVYSDLAMEILLQKIKPIMEKELNLKLVENYSYLRIYKKGDVLLRHKDRMSCEISTTLNLGGDSWPIYLEPDPSVGAFDKDDVYCPGNTKGVRIDLEPGDMLVYLGCELEHWRDKFEGEECVQVFLHYNDFKTKGNKNKFDTRNMLGLPQDFKKN